MPYADVPAFTAKLKDAPGPAAKALMFAVLTAARTGEVLGATFDEIDLGSAVWTVPAGRMKPGRAAVHRRHRPAAHADRGAPSCAS